MVSPLRFFWGKILPISYSNYLSETEILEMFRRRLDEVILEVNKISEYIEKDLADDIAKIADQRIEEYYQTVILPQLNDLNTALDELKESIDIRLSDLRNEMELCCQQVNNRIDDLDKKVDTTVNYILNQLKANSDKMDTMLDSVRKMIANLESKVDFNKAWLEKELGLAKSQWLLLLNKQYNIIIRWCRKYFDDLSQYNIIVTNPITGKDDTLNNVLYAMFQYQAGGLTAYEYRELELTAMQYYELFLTAYEYRVFGIHGVKGDDRDKYWLYSLLGVREAQPLSSVWSVFGRGQNAEMNGWDITAEQYRALSDVITDYNIEKWGRYYFSNHGSSVLKDVIHLTADTIAVTHAGVEEITGILKIDEDNGIVDTQELLTDISLKHLIKDIAVEVVNWQMGHYSIAINQLALVDGGIAFNGKVNNGCTYSYIDEDGDLVTQACTLMIDVTAITSTIELGGE